MCNTKRACKYECWLGKCTIKNRRIPDDAYCMKEGEEETAKKRVTRRKKTA